MPVQYPTGITAEHKAVREKAGLFDVSHMGEFIVRGKQAVEFVNYVTTNDVAALAGQAQYSTILNDRGTIEDDCLVYRAADHILMVVNASNIDKDFAHISRQLAKFEATLENISDKTALLALQGPEGGGISPAPRRDPARGNQILRVLARQSRRRRRTSTSRAPATPARTDSSCTSRTSTR